MQSELAPGAVVCLKDGRVCRLVAAEAPVVYTKTWTAVELKYRATGHSGSWEDCGTILIQEDDVASNIGPMVEGKP